MPPTVREQIEHVVVLILENRSFDHMLGFMDGPGMDPLTGNETIPVDPHRPDGHKASPYLLDAGSDVTADPKHGFVDVMRQLTGTEGPWTAPYQLSNNGFVWNYKTRVTHDTALAKEILGCHRAAQLPALWGLAREFSVCTQWFCSLPSETWPNRLFAHAATSDGTIANEIRPYTNPTIFEQLDAAGRDWRIYAGDIPQVAAFTNLLWHPHHDRFELLEGFARDAAHGRLPAYSFIEPRHFIASNSQHPPQHVGAGDELIRSIYLALTHDPAVWNHALFVVVYDEHGGFYDRRPPPAAIPPVPGMTDDEHGFAFDLLGPRVPAVVVSPFIPAGTVASGVLEHSSIVATLQELFDIPGSLTDRDANAATFTSLLTLEEPREPPQLPPPVHTLEELRAAQDASRWAEGYSPTGTIQLNDLQSSLVELKRLLDTEQAAQRPELAPPSLVPAPQPPFRSAAEVDAFIADFQRRHIVHS